MELVFTPEAWADYQHWLEVDPRRLKKINALLKEILREPFGGIGKPEPLKHDFKGCWSRRIDGEHRIIYKVAGTQIWLLQLRYHY